MSVKVEKEEKSLLELLQRRGFFSPDFSELRYRQEILLFVYDNLKRGTLEHDDYMHGSRYLGKAQTVSSNYVMKLGCDFPLVFEEKVLIHAAIQGEAYLVSPQHIIALDEHQQNNLFMNRKLERILLFDQDDSPALEKPGQQYLKYKWTLGFIYVANKEAHKDAKLEKKAVRQVRSAGHGQHVNAILGRPYYEWDTWEGSWPETESHHGYNLFGFPDDEVWP